MGMARKKVPLDRYSRLGYTEDAFGLSNWKSLQVPDGPPSHVRRAISFGGYCASRPVRSSISGISTYP